MIKMKWYIRYGVMAIGIMISAALGEGDQFLWSLVVMGLTLAFVTFTTDAEG